MPQTRSWPYLLASLVLAAGVVLVMNNVRPAAAVTVTSPDSPDMKWARPLRDDVLKVTVYRDKDTIASSLSGETWEILVENIFTIKVLDDGGGQYSLKAESVVGVRRPDIMVESYVSSNGKKRFMLTDEWQSISAGPMPAGSSSDDLYRAGLAIRYLGRWRLCHIYSDPDGYPVGGGMVVRCPAIRSK